MCSIPSQSNSTQVEVNMLEMFMSNFMLNLVLKARYVVHEPEQHKVDEVK